MDWKSYKSSKARKQGLKDGTHVVSLYTRNGKLHIDADVDSAKDARDTVLALGEALTTLTGCRVKLVPPKPRGLVARIKWRVGQWR